jgi:hypothetical protein
MSESIHIIYYISALAVSDKQENTAQLQWKSRRQDGTAEKLAMGPGDGLVRVFEIKHSGWEDKTSRNRHKIEARQQLERGHF